MKALERIFLYSALAILFFYVFLVDGNVESKVAIQEEIRARSIVIVNDAGQEVVKLLSNDENNGVVIIYNKDGTPVVKMIASESGGMMGVSNKDGNPVALMGASESGGEMSVKSNKGGKAVAFMTVNKDDGVIAVFNKNSEVIGHLP